MLVNDKQKCREENVTQTIQFGLQWWQFDCVKV